MLCVCFVFTYKGRPDTQVHFDAQQKAGSVVLNLLSGIFPLSLCFYVRYRSKVLFAKRSYRFKNHIKIFFYILQFLGIKKRHSELYTIKKIIIYL